jgi:hypothetical protein
MAGGEGKTTGSFGTLISSALSGGNTKSWRGSNRTAGIVSQKDGSYKTLEVNILKALIGNLQ